MCTKLSLLNMNPRVLILNPYIINKNLNSPHFKAIYLVILSMVLAKLHGSFFINSMSNELSPPYIRWHIVFKNALSDLPMNLIGKGEKLQLSIR